MWRVGSRMSTKHVAACGCRECAPHYGSPPFTADIEAVRAAVAALDSDPTRAQVLLLLLLDRWGSPMRRDAHHETHRDS